MSTATHPTRFASATKPSRRRTARRSHSADRRAQRRYQYRPFLEPLEDRRLLAGVVELISAAHPDFESDSQTANGSSQMSYRREMVSADGRYTAFISKATDLVWGMHIEEGVDNVYRFDRETGEIILVSVNTDGTGSGNGSSQYPSISADGSVIAFRSQASNLHVLDTDTHNDVFVRNLNTNETHLVSVNMEENGNGSRYSTIGPISADGSVVTFYSPADNLHPLKTDTTFGDVFARRIDWETNTGTTHLVSVSTDGSGGGNADSEYPVAGHISADGSVIAFASTASNLHPLDTDTDRDIFARRIDWETNTGTTHLVSVNANGTASGNGASGSTSASPALWMSADASVIVFQSDATDLHPLDTDTSPDIFARRIDWEDDTGTTHLISVNQEGTGSANGSSRYPQVSDDGSTIVFVSHATNLNPLKTDTSVYDVFARRMNWDTNTGTTELVSVNVDGTGGHNTGMSSSMDGFRVSGDGSRVVFGSYGSNLHPLKTDTAGGIFVRDLEKSATFLTTINRDGSGNGNDTYPRPRISADGSVVVFWSDATNLVDDDLNEARDLFLVQLQNLPPVALDDHYAVFSEQTPLVVGASQGVLANDGNPRPGPLTAELVDGPSQGQLTLSEDGSFVYTPAPGFAGDVTFTYKATDGDKPSNEATVTITVLVTKFYVVNDASADQTYEYSATGELVESYGLGSGNTAPRGVTTTVVGDKTWVVDANRKVYVYDTSGGLLGSWTAGTLASNATVEGIATNGTDIWIVDARSDKVFKYTNAASRLTGSQNAASSFSLNRYNRSPKDMVTDGTSIWVVNDTTTDKVFKYSMSGSLLGSWTISNGGGRPTGLTIDPSNASQDIWIVDSQTDRVYQYTGARTRTSGSQSAAATFALAVGNGNPQGIADPPPPAGLPALQVAVNPVAAPVPSMLSRLQVDTLEGSFAPPMHVEFALESPSTRVDSLSAVAPEIGHRFGHGHALDAHWLMAERLPVGFADQTPVRAVDRLMAVLGRRWNETIEPLEDVLEELINAEL